jgi:hypothetical protein
MPTSLPADEVLLEQAIVDRIRALFLEVPLIAEMVIVHARERFPDNDEDDMELSTVPDPINTDMPMTSIIQIGIPTVEEKEYTGDTCTQLTFTYPISFDLAVKDVWEDSAGPLVYRNSRSLAMAIYLKARRHFKMNRDLGFENCVHKYLQQEQAGTGGDEETGSYLHTMDWSLTVECTGVLV